MNGRCKLWGLFVEVKRTFILVSLQIEGITLSAGKEIYEVIRRVGDKDFKNIIYFLKNLREKSFVKICTIMVT